MNMRKYAAVLLIAGIVLLCGCVPAATVTPQPSEPAQTAGTTHGTPGVTEESTKTAPADTDGPTQEVTQEPAPTPTQDITPEPTKGFEIIGPQAGSVDIYADGDSSKLLVGMDQFGRTFDVQAGTRKKQVGMFFWLWQGYHYAHGQMNDAYDATKILEKYGADVLFRQDSSVSPAGQFHFWGEPLFGYYDQADEWVIRRQMELLTDAGVDFIVFDTTNAWTYETVYFKICAVIEEMQKAGLNPPKVAFYTHSMSIQTVNKIYREFYKPGKYKSTWYYMNGKPMIIGYTEAADDIKEAKSRGDNSYNPSPLSQEVLSFFTFKRPQWPSDPFYADGFPWIEWSYPQPVHNGIMNVAVASHPQVPMSFSITRGYKNWGRGYDVEAKVNISEDADRGTFFQSEWDQAIKQDPDMVFVDGWNEWIALKSLWDGEYMLCDAASKEFSRDIEMMKGGYNDAFYIQLIKNIRAYKGVKLTGKVASTEKSIDINGDISQWDTVNSKYTANIKSVERDHRGISPKQHYKQEAARNDVQWVKVTRDNENIYFLIACRNKIKGSGSGYMNLFIGTGRVSDKGWNGYEYVINRKLKNGVSEVARLNGSFGQTKCGQAQVSVSGKYMQLAVPRSVIGLEGSSEFYFKVADNIASPGDIMDYYVSGKSFPLGRMSYQYLG